MYWILIEILHQQPESKIEYQTYSDYIDFYGRLDGENEQMLNKLKQVLIQIGLLINQDDFIYSNRVLENKKQRKEISDKRSLAGKKSAEIRQNLTNAEQNINKGQQGKEKKGKERKEINRDIESSPRAIAEKFFNDLKEQDRVVEEIANKYQSNQGVVKTEIVKFVSYWTEPNKSGTKQRWEIEKTFEISRRLATWFSRINNFNGQPKSKFTTI
jgi:galactose-1-phosphate uridylyltransferase